MISAIVGQVYSLMAVERARTAPYEFQQLAEYNAELARGLVHTDEWKARMAIEQRRFNQGTTWDRDACAWIAQNHPPALSFLFTSHRVTA